MAQAQKKTKEETPPEVRAENGKMKPLYVTVLRVSAGLTQAKAAELVHAHVRTWRKWEGEEGTQNHRYIPEMAIELFCLKRGLTYPPKFNLKEDESA